MEVPNKVRIFAALKFKTPVTKKYMANNKQTYAIKYRLKTEPWQESALEKMFRTWNHIYNNMFSYMCRLLHEAEKDPNFKHTKSFIIDYTTPMGTDNAAKIFNDGKIKGGNVHDVTKKFIAPYKTTKGHQGCAYVESMGCRNIMDRIAKAIQSAFGEPDGRIHRRSLDVYTSNMVTCNGKKYYGPFSLNGSTFSIHYKKDRWLNFPLVIDKNDSLRMDSLNFTIKQMSLKREMVRGHYKYYAVLTFNDEKIVNQQYKLGEGKVGIDPGPRKIHYAAAPENVPTCEHKDLGSKNVIMSMNAKIDNINRKLDRSRRANNPQNYNEDGTIKEGKRLKWNNSNNYVKLRNKKKELNRRLTVKRKQYHYDLANDMLRLGDTFYYEHNSYRGMAKRSSKTSYTKKGTIRSKKRFGRSIGNYAPYQFMTILKQKVTERNGTFIEVDERNAATQFDFTNQSFTKHGLSERRVTLSNGQTHDRDLISAFNLRAYIGPERKPKDKNKVEKSASNYNVKLMKQDYKHFINVL